MKALSKMLITLLGLFVLLLLGLIPMEWTQEVGNVSGVHAGTINGGGQDYLAIVDVYVTNRDSDAKTPPYGDSSYTGLAWVDPEDEPVCTVPYKPDSVGILVIPTDINKDIGGDYTYIWVRYDWVSPTADTPVLVDIAVHHWPYWETSCPDGWEAANGDEDGRLTTRTDGDCWRNGLCVHYEPMNQTETFITNLSISRENNIEKRAPGLCPANGGAWAMELDTLDIHKECGDDYFYYLSYNRARKWPSMPELPDQPLTPSDSDKAAILTTYAPQVTLADGEPILLPPVLYGDPEKYYPSPVEWAFAYLNRVWYREYYIIPPLFGDSWWLFTKETLDSPSDVLGYFYGCDGGAHNPCDLDDVPVYAFWDQVDIDVDGKIVRVYDLLYFLYFPYNRGKEVSNTVYGNHVSDWEHVSVRIMPQWDEQTGWILKPVQIYLPFHSWGNGYLWEDFAKQPGDFIQIFMPIVTHSDMAAATVKTMPGDDGRSVSATIWEPTHPLVYASWGSHGIWRTLGKNYYMTMPIGDNLYDYCGDGDYWKTWRRVEAYNYDDKIGLNGIPWPTWMEEEYDDPTWGDSDPASGPIKRWGNYEDGCDPILFVCRLDSGPTGPVSKNVWDVKILR